MFISVHLSYTEDEGYLANSCQLLNRHQLSRSQDRELQRYIDENFRLLQYVERPIGDCHSMQPHSAFCMSGLNFLHLNSSTDLGIFQMFCFEASTVP
ncbi:unnamed protein product [Toxocara canis]|uniref:Ring finger protein 213 n=1 Tax=Toxocara canis TaxID=6265 RepID=A0A183TUT1_TOXCA|nr:unnamed protein product [Toxocara canis]